MIIKGRDNLAREFQDEHEAKLDRNSANQRERLTRESQDEREARLERMNANQRERLARESHRTIVGTTDITLHMNQIIL